MKHHPLSAAEKADAYTTAKVRYTEANGTSATHDLAYHRIFATAEIVGGNMVGGPYDANDRPLTDNLGQMASDSPDGTSLLHVDGLVVPGGTGAPLAMVTQFEYRDPPRATASALAVSGASCRQPPALRCWTRTARAAC
jgi:uncharacterized protein